MKKLIATIVMLTLILLPTVLAQEDFSAQAKSLFSLEKCVIEKNIIKVTNTGTQTNNYLLEGSGKTADWVQYPGMFSLEPGKSTNVEALLTVPCTASAGNYQILTTISTTTGLEKEIIQDLIVKPTQNIEVSVKEQTKTVKPCSRASYLITVKNPSSFQEKYTLSADNLDVKLSKEEITLEANETKQITVEYSPEDCMQTGEISFLFTAETEKTKLIAELDLFLEIQDYGVAEIASGLNKIRTYYNENIVDLGIFNTGNDDVNYIISVEGADWITVSPRMLTVAGGETEKVTLNLAPTENVKKGKHSITLTAEIEETGAVYEKELVVKLTTPGITDNLFDKYLPLTVLIIIALIVFGVIAVYSAQYMSTEEYQKQRLKRLKQKEKLKRQRKREKTRKRKEKEKLRREHAKEKERIKEERERLKERKRREKERAAETKLRLQARKEKQAENSRLKKQKAEAKLSKKHEKKLREKYLMISRDDIAEGKRPKNVFSKIIFAVIIIALLVIIAVFIQPIINNIQYVIAGVAVLIILFILTRIRQKRVVTAKWKGLSLAKETKILDVNWRKGVQQIKLKLASPIKKLKAKIKKGRGRNERYICIDEHVYQYFKTETNTENENISNTEIIFRVRKKWMDRKNIDPEEIMLYQLDNGEWCELETEQIDSDEKYVYYTADASKLGQFAIIGTETAEEIEEEKSKTKGIIALVGIIVIAAIIFMLLKPAIQLPTAGIPSQTWLQGEQQSLDLNLYFQDPDRDILEFGLKESVENIDIWFKDGIAYLTPDAEFLGERTVIFTADDSKGGYAESNPVKLIVKDKETNWFVRVIKVALGIIILLAILMLLIKLVLLIKEGFSE